jgi:hypothetical protein
MSWKVYSSEIPNKDNLVSYQSPQKISLQPGKTGVYSFTIPTISDPVSLVVFELSDGEKKSIYSFRILKANATHATVTALSLGSFPVRPGEKAEVVGCVSAGPTGKSDFTKRLRLSIVRPEGQKIADLGTISGTWLLTAISRQFTPLAGIRTPIVLKAELLNQSGAVESTASVSYSCDKIACPSDLTFGSFISGRPYVIVIVGLLIVAAAVAIMRKRKQSLIPKQ